MLTENNWFESNIRERLVDREVLFSVEVKPYAFKEKTFDDACLGVAEKISKYKLVLSLSGGYDSEYVFRVLMKAGVDFETVIVNTDINTYEAEYAFHVCREYDVHPKIMYVKEERIVKTFYEEIYKKVGGVGISSVPQLITGWYAESIGAKLVTGEHILDDNYVYRTTKLGVNEWDYYNDALLSPTTTIPFFMYDIETVHSMVKVFEPGFIDEFKYKLYKIDYRPKFKYMYSKEVLDVVRRLAKKEGTGYDFGDRDEFLKFLEQHKES